MLEVTVMPVFRAEQPLREALAAAAELVLLDPLDLQAPTEIRDSTDSQDRMDNLDLTPSPTNNHLPTSSASIAQLVHQDSQEGQDQRARQAPQETTVYQAIQLNQAHPDHQAHPVHPETTANPETQELQDSRASSTKFREPQALLDPQDLPDLQAHQETPDVPDNQDSQAYKVRQEMPETTDFPETLEHQENKELLEATENREAAVTAHRLAQLQDIKRALDHHHSYCFASSVVSVCHSPVTALLLLKTILSFFAFCIFFYFLLSTLHLLTRFGCASQIREVSSHHPHIQTSSSSLLYSVFYKLYPWVDLYCCFFHSFISLYNNLDGSCLTSNAFHHHHRSLHHILMCTSCDTNQSISKMIISTNIRTIKFFR